MTRQRELLVIHFFCFFYVVYLPCYRVTAVVVLFFFFSCQCLSLPDTDWNEGKHFSGSNSWKGVPAQFASSLFPTPFFPFPLVNFLFWLARNQDLCPRPGKPDAIQKGFPGPETLVGAGCVLDFQETVEGAHALWAHIGISLIAVKRSRAARLLLSFCHWRLPGKAPFLKASSPSGPLSLCAIAGALMSLG